MRNKFGLLQHGSILYDVSIEDILIVSEWMKKKENSQ